MEELHHDMLTPLLSPIDVGRSELTAFDKSLLQLIKNEQQIPPTSRRGRTVAKICAVVLSGATKIFFIPISLRLPAGPLFAAANSAGFLKLEYWAASATIDDIMADKTPAERSFYGQREMSLLKKIALAGGAWIVADLSQVPTALAAVVYNEEKYKVAAAVVMIVSGSLFPTRSLQLSLMQVLNRESIGEHEKQFLKLKKDCVALLKRHQEVFIQSGRERQLGFIREIDGVRDIEEYQDKINEYLALMLPSAQDLDQPSAVRSYSMAVAGGIGAALTGIFQTALALYTWETSKDVVWDNPVSAGVFTTLVVGSNLYLTGKSLITTTQRIFKFVGNMFGWCNDHSLAEQLRPKLTFCMQALGFIVDALALGPTVVIWGDFFKDNEFKQKFFQISLCLSIFLLLFTSTLDMIDEAIEDRIALKGSEEEKKIVAMKKELQKLATLVEKSPLVEFMGIMSRFPESFKQRLLQRVRISLAEFDQYMLPSAEEIV